MNVEHSTSILAEITNVDARHSYQPPQLQQVDPDLDSEQENENEND